MDTGSAAAMVWVARFEKLMLIMAYVLTFLIIFTAAVVGKGTTFWMIAQVKFMIKKCTRSAYCTSVLALLKYLLKMAKIISSFVKNDKQDANTHNKNGTKAEGDKPVSF